MVFPGWLHSWLRVRSPQDTRGLQDSGGPASGRLYFARLDPSGRCGPAPNDAASDPAATHQTFSWKCTQPPHALPACRRKL